MNLSNIQISEKLVPANYMKHAQEAQTVNETAVKELLEKRKLPEHGWSDERIEGLLRRLATLDSNNFPHTAGLGEREARIACTLVARRHYNFGHGIGRSGDLLEAQPKAAGSTLLSNLTNALLLELIHEMGVRSCRACFLAPLATGMSLTLCLLTLRRQRPKAKYVLWSRIDQKSCFKSIIIAGLTPLIVDPVLDTEGQLSTDIDAFERLLLGMEADTILCLFTTTSCFAPRSCDDLLGIAQLAARHQLPHLVNNAYGLQSMYLTHQLEQAQRLGRVDLFVQSTDKNLLVPVGGAIIAGCDEQLVYSVAKSYPGRASSSQTLDVFMTLLSMGKVGYMQLIRERKQSFEYLREKLVNFAQDHGEVVISLKRNPISLALTLKHLQPANDSNREQLTKFGSMLYTRGVSGVRVVATGESKTIEGHTFLTSLYRDRTDWGTHHSATPTSYLTVAAALGVTIAEIDVFFKKLYDCWKKFVNT